MNPEIKSKWLEALESGRYNKGSGYLHYKSQGEHNFCCLGVLCEIAVHEGVIEPGRLSNGTDVYQYGAYWVNAYLPHEVVVWSGLSGKVTDSEALAELNDKSITFKPVIEEIEKHF